jgi:pimeloyl-ACP methyl ester carboxylesterase
VLAPAPSVCPVFPSLRPRSYLASVRGEFLDLDGVRLYYYAAGSRGAGEPIVLIHGFPTSSHLWTAVAPLLPLGHRVVVLDLLGFGRSDPATSGDVSLVGHANRLVAILDHLGINVACVVGHDVGGGIAQSVAVRHPRRVSRLGLVSSVAFDAWPTRTGKLARALLPLTRHLPPVLVRSAVRTALLRGYEDRERGVHDVELFLRPFAGRSGRDALTRHIESLDSSETSALAPTLADIESPTAIIWGERDPFLPAALAERLKAAIPRSTLEVVPGARHFLPVECANAVAASIAKLLAR